MNADDEAVEAVDNPAERLHLSEAMRMAEALVFASAEPVSEKALAARLPEGIDVPQVMAELHRFYEKRGVNLVRVADAWAFRTAGDLAFLMSRLSPADHARRDGGHTRRRDLEGHARPAA
jgi:segregation and condensation protein B